MMKMILPPLLDDQQVGPLSDLEAGLTGPDAAKVRDEAIERIDVLEASLRQKLNYGVSNADFPQFSALLEACQASRDVLKQVARAT